MSGERTNRERPGEGRARADDADARRSLTGMSPDRSFWRGKRVVLTGHTGFKGAWLALWLRRLGAEVTGIALAADEPSLYRLVDLETTIASRTLDLRDAAAIATAVRAARPEVVFHLAAQALVRASYREPLATFATNTMGTAHLLDALRDAPDVRVAVVVTTDKVYLNREWAYPYRESDALGGHDPYSASKAAAELVAASYRSAFLQAQGVAVATARAGNVIGGGDWCEDRLIPDAVRAWSTGAVLRVRRPGRDPALAARARSARRLPAPGREAVGCARARERLQLRPAHRRGGERRRRHRARARRLRRGRMERRCRRAAARTKPAGSRSKWRGRASSSASPHDGA